jgi:signal transduction histidine kinase/sensor domain CHASE-containing protein
LSSAFRKLLPILLFFFFGAITTVLWKAQIDHEHQLIVHHVESSAEQARVRISDIISSRISALELLADRWVDRKPADFSRQRFLSFAEAVFAQYPGFSKIYWADPDGFIGYVFPLNADADKLGKKIEYPGLPDRTAVIRADWKRELAVSPCFDICKAEKGFQVVLPLVFEGELQGYLCGEFLVAQIIEVALPKSIMKDFRVSIYEGDQPIFHSLAPVSAGHKIFLECGIEIGERNWRLKMEPGPAVYSGPHGSLPFLAFGIFLSASLSLLAYLLLLRMEAYRQSRDIALSEVTERKRVEAVLQENEKKLQALVSELSTKNIELESFIYTISHDLKTPIVTIDGFIGALREDFGSAMPKAAENYLDYMSGAAHKMGILIDDLLDLSRIGRLVGKRSKVPFGAIAREATETLEPNLKARGILVDIQENLPEVYCEKKRLGQVLYNLLSNAIKYIGRDNSAPRIEIGAKEQDGQWVFFVRDNGIGIEERFFEKIFQIFERLPSARKEEGTGIGLAIVKRIIDYHGGRIWLNSEPGRGTTFFFTIDNKES